MDRLYKATYFIKLDTIRSFNSIFMGAGEEQKTAFRTRLGLYEYLVLFFRLSNGPGTFQNYINDILGNDILYLFVTAYIDNILVFSKMLQEYKKHVMIVLAHLQVASLQQDIEK